jgi:valyl-tRNA synthetase
MVEKYGADALRMGLVVGTAAGNDTSISEDKIRAYRNFANKIWNAARFIRLSEPHSKAIKTVKLNSSDKRWLDDFDKFAKRIGQMMDKYQIGQAGELLYDYFWHTFCDKYIEEAKPRLQKAKEKEAAAATLSHILKQLLIMLHPFVPFVTEAVWQEFKSNKKPLISEQWPV